MTKLLNIESGFAQVKNEVLNDPTLSWKAKGLFAFLASKPHKWDFSSKRMKNDSTDGYRAVLAGLRELEFSGYLARKKEGNGRMIYSLDHTKKHEALGAVSAPSRNRTVPKPHSAETAPISNTESDSNTKKKEIKSSDGVAITGKEVNDFLDKFGAVNPNHEQLFKRKPQREAMERMLAKHGAKAMEATMTVMVECAGDEYCPTITTPIQLESKMAALIIHWRKKNGNGGKSRMMEV